MTNNFDITNLSAVPIYHSKIKNDNYLEAINIIEDIEFVSATKNKVSKNTDILSDIKFINYKIQCESHLKTFIDNVICCSQEFYIINSWIAVTLPGQEHSTHYHPNSIFSGVVYLQSDKQSGNLQFNWKSPIKSEYGFNYDCFKYNLYNSEFWSFSPETGDIIIFPSWLRHSVSKNNSNEPRIVLGFNTFVKGEFGGSEYAAKLIL